MNETLLFFEDISKGIPSGVMALSLFLMSFLIITILVIIRNYTLAKQIVFFILLLEYCFFIFCVTIFFRPAPIEVNCNLQPFWSYTLIINRSLESSLILKDNIQNILMLIPMGFLLCFIEKVRKLWMATLIGFLFSSIIELTQFYFKRGFCEFDDVFHNTLGCVIGYGIGLLMIFIISKMRST